MQNGVVLGADTRSTAGSTVADKNCEKIHYIAPNIYCCGAGTAADTENVTGMPVTARSVTAIVIPDMSVTSCSAFAGMIASHLELHRYGTGRGSRVVTALTLLNSHLFKYQAHVSSALVLGGVDLNGPHLFTVSPLAMIAGIRHSCCSRLTLLHGCIMPTSQVETRVHMRWFCHQS